MLSNLWTLLKRFVGWPEPATEAQKNEKLVTMREFRDCHCPVVANTTSEALGRRVTYEEASKALYHWNLPWLLESPLLSNPWNVCRAIRKLGCKADDKAKITQLLRKELPEGRTICLMHDTKGFISGTIGQHWVVLMGYGANNTYVFHWGKSQKLQVYCEADVIKMLTSGTPNCLITVSK